MSQEINIVVNGFKESVPENTSLSFLIERFKEGDADLIVEHNGRFIYPDKYSAVTVSEGDSVEFINPNFGG